MSICLPRSFVGAVSLFAAACVPSGAATAATYTLAPVADSFVSGSYVDTNYGSDNFLYAHHGASEIRRTYLRFDLSGLPTGEALADVTLFLYTGGGEGGLAVDVHAVADDSWAETELTWRNRPGFTPTALATARTPVTPTPPATPAPLDAWMSWSLPLGSLSGDTDGHWSLLLKLQDETASDTATFYSRDATVYPNYFDNVPAPFLSVTTVPESSTWAMLFAGLAALALATSRRRTG